MKRIEKIKERLFNREYVTRKSWWGEGGDNSCKRRGKV